MKNKNVSLNKALFLCKSFDSASLGVLSAIHHRFDRPGDYDLLVDRNGKAQERMHVHVAKEDAPESAVIDLATGPGENGCACDERKGARLRVGGSICLYAGTGSSEYAITLSGHDGKGGTTVVLESRKALPAGDVFSTTLVRPGLYRASLAHSRSTLDLRVSMPEPKQPKVDGACVIKVNKEGFDTSKADMIVGQTVFFALESDASVRIDLIKPQHDDKDMIIRGKKHE